MSGSLLFPQTPQFTHRNAAHSAFWDERFNVHFTPWDKGAVPLQLQHFCHALTAQNNQTMRALIPGCGNAYELAYLAQLGWDALAIDFSAAAVASAKALHPQFAARIIQADFFDFIPKNPLDVIGERAFLCALPPTFRAQIAAHWAKLLPVNGLLLGYFFIDEQASKQGPPFGMSQADVDALLLPHFECVENSAVEDSLPVFKGRERWQVWRRLHP